MALFKIKRGKSIDLPEEFTNGCIYFCTDTSEFYIDYLDEDNQLQRKALNAQDAKTLSGTSLTTITEQINKKVEKIDGKGLSTNDYTTEEKNKLANIPTAVDEADVILFEEFTSEQIQQLWDSVIV